MGSSDKYKSWRKRTAGSFSDKLVYSDHLREARDFIQKREFSKALDLLDQQSLGGGGLLKKSKIVGLVGDSLAERGKLVAAIETYKKAEALTEEHPRAWLRPVISQVKHLLRHGLSDDAFETARKGIARSLKEERGFKRLKKQLEQEITETGEAVIVSRPHRSSVVATRFGHLFLAQGELEAAKFFLDKVIQVNPKGGCRARLGLAEIALRSQDYESAEYWALDGIVNGKYQAKTLSGWPILITARRGLDKEGLPIALLEWLGKNRTTSVGERAVQHIVEELRKSEDPLWKKVAKKWLRDSSGDNVTLECHLRKLFLADAKANKESPEKILQFARALWNTRNLSLRENISATRATVECLLALGKEIDEEQFISKIEKAYGIQGRDRARQAIAELLYQFDQKQRAFELVSEIADDSPIGSKRWGQATWKLAKWKHETGATGEAAEYYLSIAEQEKTPERIRNFALVDALRMAGVAKRDDLTMRAKPYLQSALAMISEPGLLLDISRQLGSAPDSRDLYDAYRAKGQQTIEEAIASSAHPSQAATLLFKYARRQNDWGDFEGTIRVWEAMDAQRRLWIWSPKQEYWEYLAFVMRAYTWQERAPKAEAMALEYVNDPATNPDGVAILGNSYAALLMYQDRTEEGLGVFKRVVHESPQHVYAAYGYYWFALQALNLEQSHSALQYSASMTKCLDERSKLTWVQRLRIRAEIIQYLANEGSAEGIALALQRYSSKDLEDNLKVIQMDRKKV